MLGMLFVLVPGSVYSLMTLTRAVDDVTRTDERQLAANRLLQTLVDAETGQRGYLATGDREFLDVYFHARGAGMGELELLTQAFGGNDARIDALRLKVEHKIAELERTRAAYDRGERDGPLADDMRHGKSLMDEIRVLVGGLLPQISREAQRATVLRTRLASFMFVGSLSLIAALLAIVWLQLQRQFDRILILEGEMHHRLESEQYLIGIVSHDLRTPITSILLSAQAHQRHASEKDVKYVERVVSSAKRANMMIADLLDFTKARYGGLPVERQSVDVHEVVRNNVGELQVGFPDRDVRLIQRGDGSADLDPQRFGQVVANLARNALTYSPPGSPVEVTSLGGESGVLLTVHNLGEPIPPDKQGHLFEPMQRASVAGAGQRNIGLGLFIVNAIVKAHGGSIEVQSSRESGTTVTVRLPKTPRSMPPEGHPT